MSKGQAEYRILLSCSFQNVMMAARPGMRALILMMAYIDEVFFNPTAPRCRSIESTALHGGRFPRWAIIDASIWHLGNEASCESFI